MKKRILTVALVIALLAVCFAGTYAYLMDTDSVKNTMTLGNVSIEQTEWQRVFDEEGNLTGFEPFEQAKKMFPGVYTNANAGATKVYFNDEDTLYIADGQAWCGMWSESAGQYNAIDKIVVVKNDGKSDVYYRTLVAIESTGEYTGSWGDSDNAELVVNYNDNERFNYKHVGKIQIGTVYYQLYVFEYNQVLTPGEMSRPSLLQLMFDKDCTNDNLAAYGNTLDVLCLSQAVQAAGFQDAATALDEAFGEVTVESATAWLTPIA